MPLRFFSNNYFLGMTRKKILITIQIALIVAVALK